jgi:hypothetical protein
MEAILKRQEADPIHSGTQLGIEMLAMGIDAWSKNKLMKQEAAQEFQAAERLGTATGLNVPQSIGGTAPPFNPLRTGPINAANRAEFTASMAAGDTVQASLVANRAQARQAELSKQFREEDVSRGVAATLSGTQTTEAIRKEGATEAQAQADRDRKRALFVDVLTKSNPDDSPESIQLMADKFVLGKVDIRTDDKGNIAFFDELGRTVTPINQLRTGGMGVHDLETFGDSGLVPFISPDVDIERATGFVNTVSQVVNKVVDAFGGGLPISGVTDARVAFTSLNNRLVQSMATPYEDNRISNLDAEEFKKTLPEPGGFFRGTGTARLEYEQVQRVVNGRMAFLKSLSENDEFTQTIRQKAEQNRQELQIYSDALGTILSGGAAALDLQQFEVPLDVR